MNAKLCALCGKKVATTKEHVPPKAIFLKPRPVDTITVPACFDCNNHSSQLDESFLAHLGMHVGAGGEMGQKVFEQRALSTLKNNSRLRNWVISRMKPVQVLSANNESLGELHLGLWDSEAHSSVIEKCVRGLHYFHYKEILAGNTSIKTHYFRSLTPEMVEMSKGWASNSIGGDQFVYRYTSGKNESRRMSLWLFQFFGAHWAGGQTLSELESGRA